MRQVFYALLSATLFIALGASAAAAEDDLKTAAVKTGVLAHMMAAKEQAGLTGGPNIGPLTLFAPSDRAFEALPATFRERLLAPENREHLVTLLLHHAIPGVFPMERLLNARVDNYAVDAIDGSEVEINKGSCALLVEGASITQGNIRASNGIIHVIDKVLIPPSVMAALSDDEPSHTKIAVEAGSGD